MTNEEQVKVLRKVADLESQIKRWRGDIREWENRCLKAATERDQLIATLEENS